MGTSIDTHWYRQLAPLSIEVLHYLKSDLHGQEAQRLAFFSGEVQVPCFDYSHIEIGQIEGKVSGLKELRERIIAQEKEAVVTELYTAKIDEYLANALLLRSAYEASVAPQHGYAAMEHFKKANTYLYGELDADMFNLTLRTLRRKLANVPQEVQRNHPEEYARLQRLVQDLPVPAQRYAFALAQQTPRDSRIIQDIVEITGLFQSALLDRGLADVWKVLVDTTGLLQTFSVVNHERVLAIPGQEYFTAHGGYTVAQLNGLIAHEIDTHIIRRHNGKRSLLRLLGAGLDRYHRGEEGIATFRAQREKGSRSFAGFLGYLSLGLTQGMERGGAAKDFAELYTLLNAYFLVVGGFTQPIAQMRAWHACWRVFRGTTCAEPGVVFKRDAMYRQGNILIHQLLAAYPDAEKDFDVGNFDPTKKTHITALLKLRLLSGEPWETLATASQ